MPLFKRRLPVLLSAAVLLCSSGTVVTSWQAAVATRPQDTFASRVAALSEPGGYFNTDNLISNERSYLHVAPQLRALSTQAAVNGVYIGVGPDQNFSYIAQLKPSMAILIDIRRDNMLLHLLFKAIFAEARTRADYLALLTGRPAPQEHAAYEKKSLEDIVAWVDAFPRPPEPGISRLRARVMDTIAGFGVSLSFEDRMTIDTFHRRFINEGLSLRFNTTGRAPQADYPNYRDLLLERDLQGRQQSFVATEADFLYMKELQRRGMVIPIVGDLAGATALPAVARFLTGSNRKVTAFYTSNVEQYLFQNGSFGRFVENLGRLPHQPASVIVRSIFPSGGTGAAFRPGYNSAQFTQPIQELLDGYAKGLFRQYRDLVR